MKDRWTVHEVISNDWTCASCPTLASAISEAKRWKGIFGFQYVVKDGDHNIVWDSKQAAA